MKPKIPKETLRRISTMENGAYTAAGRRALKWCRDRIKILLRKFAKRVRTDVQFVLCNGNFWLCEYDTREENRYVNLNNAMDSIANPSSPGVPDACPSRVQRWYHKFERKVMQAFPELVEAWWIAYELDAAPGRVGALPVSIKKRKKKSNERKPA